MVSQFPLDYMHLICLGVVRKLIYLWLKGPLPTRMHHNLVRSLSDLLLNVKSYITREFVRRPRSFFEIKQWKATELRQFLLYSGPVILCGKIPQEVYHNFLLLSVSMRMLLSPALCANYLDYVQELLETFVKNFGSIYGQNMLIYNIHNLVHLVQDAKRYGPLDNISAFPFESFLGKLKKLVRGSNYPLSQLVRRLGEKQRVKVKLHQDEEDTMARFKRQHISGPLPKEFVGAKQYKHYRGSEYIISNSRENNLCMAMISY